MPDEEVYGKSDRSIDPAQQTGEAAGQVLQLPRFRPIIESSHTGKVSGCRLRFLI